MYSSSGAPEDGVKEDGSFNYTTKSHSTIFTHVKK